MFMSSEFAILLMVVALCGALLLSVAHKRYAEKPRRCRLVLRARTRRDTLTWYPTGFT